MLGDVNLCFHFKIANKYVNKMANKYVNSKYSFWVKEDMKKVQNLPQTRFWVIFNRS